MTTRFDLPDGAWADIRDPRKITRSKRKPVRAAMLELHRYKEAIDELAAAAHQREWAAANPDVIGPIPGFVAQPEETEDEAGDKPTWKPNEAEIEMLDAAQEALTVALVADWSYEGGVSVEALDELPVDAADALIEHCSTFMDQLFVTTEPDPAEDSPTTL